MSKIRNAILVSPELSKFVDSFDDGGHDCRGRDVDQTLHVVDGLLLVQVQTKLVLNEIRICKMH